RETWVLDRAVRHDELLSEQKVFSDQLRLATREVADDTAGGGVRDGLGRARDGGASRSHPSSDNRRDEPQVSEHHLPPPSLIAFLQLGYCSGGAVPMEHTLRRRTARKQLTGRGCEW